jgi:hypothetical protein
MDGLDSLMKDIPIIQNPVRKKLEKLEEVKIKVESPILSPSTNSVSKLVDDDGWDEWDDDEIEHTKVANKVVDEEKIMKIKRKFTMLMNNLVDEEVRQKFNKKLYLQHCNYVPFIEYYLKNQDLSRYTIDTELRRMNFIVIHGTTETNNADEIISIYENNKDDIIWRIPNQSIFADILYLFQFTYINSEINVNVVSKVCDFKIDFNKRTINAISTFNLVTTTSSLEKLLIATVESTVEVNLESKSVKQVLGIPSLNNIYDDTLEDAALSIIRMNDQEKESFYQPSILDIKQRLLEEGQENVVKVAKVVAQKSEFLMEGMVKSFGRFIRADQATEFGELLTKSKENNDKLPSNKGDNITKSLSNIITENSVRAENVFEGMIGIIGRAIGANSECTAPENFSLYRRDEQEVVVPVVKEVPISSTTPIHFEHKDLFEE